MKIKIAGVRRGPRNRTFIFQGKGYHIGDEIIVTPEASKELLGGQGLFILEQVIVEPEVKAAPVSKDKMLKPERNKHGTTSKRPSDPESDEGLSLDFLE